MKKLFILCLIFFTWSFSNAQNTNECRKVVQNTIDAINSKSTDALNGSLSSNFSIAGQEGEMAKLVLNQLFTQLNDKVIDAEETSKSTLESGIQLKYNFEYQNMGIREATFIFNEKNLLQELHLFEMQVKSTSAEKEVVKSSKDVIEVPFQLVRKLIMVDVVLNGKQKKFILDTGSPTVVLNSKYLEQDSSKSTLSSSRGVNGEALGMNIEKVESLDFYGIQINDQELITLDLTHLEKELACEIHGLIGFDLIAEYDIIFDYQNSNITLVNANTFKKYKRNFLNKNQLESIPFRLEGHIPVLKATINDEALEFGIDCGAESNLIDDDFYPSLKSSLSHTKINDLSGADKSTKKVYNGDLPTMIIGQKAFKNINTAFSDISHLNEGYGLQIDGLIGYPILSQQKTLISFTREEIIFIQ